MVLEIKASHYKGTTFKGMDSCCVCNAVKEATGRDCTFNGSSVVFSEKEWHGTTGMIKSDQGWQGITYHEIDAKKHHQQAEKARFDEVVIHKLHLPSLAPTTWHLKNANTGQ